MKNNIIIYIALVIDIVISTALYLNVLDIMNNQTKNDNTCSEYRCKCIEQFPKDGYIFNTLKSL